MKVYLFQKNREHALIKKPHTADDTLHFFIASFILSDSFTIMQAHPVAECCRPHENYLSVQLRNMLFQMQQQAVLFKKSENTSPCAIQQHRNTISTWLIFLVFATETSAQYNMITAIAEKGLNNSSVLHRYTLTSQSQR